MEIKEIFLEIIKEAENAKVILGDEEYSIGFNTSINGQRIYYNENNNVELNIKNIDSFIIKLEEYINEEESFGRKSIKYLNTHRDYIKSLIVYLFVNATTEDFINCEDYIDRCIAFLKDKTFDALDTEVIYPTNGVFENEQLHIKNSKQSVMMETPNKMEFSLTNCENPNLIFKLPEISYGITTENGERVCYIYSILNKENIKETEDDKLLKYKKNISRKLYKLNKGISEYESEEFIDYTNHESDYYPENITDVSVSSVLSLYLFINLVKDKVDKIKGVPYLPIRYMSREYASQNVSSPSKQIELEERNNNIQSNLTEKFIRTFRRVEKHIPDFHVDSYPYEYNEFINCSISNTLDNSIDNEIIESFNIKR